MLSLLSIRQAEYIQDDSDKSHIFVVGWSIHFDRLGETFASDIFERLSYRKHKKTKYGQIYQRADQLTYSCSTKISQNCALEL